MMVNKRNRSLYKQTYQRRKELLKKVLQTIQNSDNENEYTKIQYMKELYEKYKIPLKYLIKYITITNIPDHYRRDQLWIYLIHKEYKKGKSIDQLKRYITKKHKK